MAKPPKTSCMIGSCFLLLVISALFFTLRPQLAEGAKNACPLTVGQETKATKAFKKLAHCFKSLAVSTAMAQ